MTSSEQSRVAVVGMAVMGKNLALNLADRGHRVAVWNRTAEVAEQAAAGSGGRLRAHAELPALVAALARPRVVVLMVKAGAAVDDLLDRLAALLEPGDLVVDGGNSHYLDTRRRCQRCDAIGLHFVGMGVSGGVTGARHGPSLMPGGSTEAYRLLRPVLEAIAARSSFGPCVSRIGPDGAGHFVKMVHNGIEYAALQLIAEVYQLLRDGLGLTPPELSGIFARWNQGPLGSFLVELTAQVLVVRDGRGAGWLVDQVLDVAGHKGTGRWTVEAALELGVPVPTIAAAVDVRALSADRGLRRQLDRRYPRQRAAGIGDREALVAAAHDALLGADIVAYAQGLALVRAASLRLGWSIDLAEVARVWTAGCIIRSRLLEPIMRAWAAQPDLGHLLDDAGLAELLRAAESGWRSATGSALAAGLPVPALAAGVAYLDALRCVRLPVNLIQAQRDAFGAHGYRSVDDPEGAPRHSEWARAD
ncbi:MAG: NADP-dependent phosphogluconate dehydrogenase [Deltaproteobacteria bacterium]|nr:NADP-dependent phosphogluconate dehydrogenase [Deltaproteobacteria bacterium]